MLNTRAYFWSEGPLWSQIWKWSTFREPTLNMAQLKDAHFGYAPALLPNVIASNKHSSWMDLIIDDDDEKFRKIVTRTLMTSGYEWLSSFRRTVQKLLCWKDVFSSLIFLITKNKKSWFNFQSHYKSACSRMQLLGQNLGWIFQGCV